MKSWVITGGMGCGKSTVCAMLRERLPHAAFFSSDEQVQQLLDQEVIVEQLQKQFGPEAVDPALRRANRAWLRSAAFADPLRRKRLEALLHPHVLLALENARERAGLEPDTNLFLAEVPLYYEIGATVSADLVIAVAASQTIQVRRLMARRGLDESTIHQMLRAQWPIDAKVERADVVIWNDGDTAALDAQVLTLTREHWTE
jgi:dephospho-CoA kinase